MNNREIAEIRRAYSAKREAVRTIVGYYVNEKKEIVTRFERSLALAGEEESERYLALFRRTLSGTQRKNLFDFAFSTSAVSDGEAHRRLMALREGDAPNAEATDAFAALIAPTVSIDGSFVILFAKNVYDVIRHGRDGEEEPGEVHRFFTVAVCPIREASPSLAYDADERAFTRFAGVRSLAAPELGFTFPAFDNRRTNIYNALFYTRATDKTHDALTRAAFGDDLPILTAKEQGDGFKAALADALGEGPSLTAAKSIRREIAERIEIHKESRDPEPLLLTAQDVKECLEASGLKEEEANAFAASFAGNLGSRAEIAPKNLIDPGRFVLKTPDVVIRVADGKEDLVAVKSIDGAKYILIRANAGVELNGLPLRVDGEDGE